MFKNKFFILSLIVNVVCIVVIIILDVVLFNSLQNKTECKVEEKQVLPKQIAYHCETGILKDGVDTYTYTRNYDFTFRDDKLASYSYYAKAQFTDIEVYKYFTAKKIGQNEDVKTRQDDQNLIKYFDLGYIIKFNGETLENYIKQVESKEKMTCKEIDINEMLTF